MTRKIGDDAFERYVALGPGRSYKAIAEVFEVSKRAVVKHAAKERWAERLERIERKARERSDERMVETLEEMRARHMTTLKVMNARALSALKQLPLSTGMEAVRAAETVIKLERLIAGEASERSEVSVEAVTRRELQRWLVKDGGGNDDET